MTIDKSNLMALALIAHIIQALFVNPDVIASYGMLAIAIYYVVTILSRSYNWVMDRWYEGY